MIVAVVQTPPPVTGLSAVNQRMVSELFKTGNLAAVVNIAPTENSVGLRKHGGRFLRFLEAAIKIISLRSVANVLYMPSDGGAGIIWNVLLSVIARIFKYKIFIHHHSFAYINQKSVLMSWHLKLLPKRTRHLVLCKDMIVGLQGQYAATWSTRMHDASVLSNAFMATPWPTSPMVNKRLVMGHLSNLTEEKGSIRFIEIFYSARRIGMEISAVLAGPVGDEPTRQAIKKAIDDFPESFNWIGPVYGGNKNEFYNSIDVFVFPSDYPNEAQPVVLMEALACGVPVLSTARGCIVCDHLLSPGLVAPIGEFQDRALNWLEEHLSVNSREIEARRSLEAFSALQNEAELQLSEVILEMQPGQ